MHFYFPSYVCCKSCGRLMLQDSDNAHERPLTAKESVIYCASSSCKEHNTRYILEAVQLHLKEAL